MSETEETALVVDNGGPGKIATVSVSPHAWLDTATFDQAYRVAKAMANMSLLPAHLRRDDMTETASNAFLVVMQAVAWEMSPFALMGLTFPVGGKLGYEGKAVAAIVNTRAGLKGRLSYAYSGKGLDREVTVSGTFAGEDEPRTLTGCVKDWKTNNKMWLQEGPSQDQKLSYVGATWWARRHCPEVILGVHIAEEEGYSAEVTTPPRTPLTAHPAPAKLLPGNDLTTPDAAYPPEWSAAEEAATVEASRRQAADHFNGEGKQQEIGS